MEGRCVRVGSIFFFQAEDGIRDLTVTGVQTCALPISLSLIADPDTYLVLEDLKREGKIRFYGVSVHPPEEGLAAVEVTRPDTVQIVYNLVRREAEDRFFVVARASNVGVIAREPLANGLLAGKYGRDSTWDKGDIRARMPRPYVAQLTAVAERVKDLGRPAGVTAAQQ